MSIAISDVKLRYRNSFLGFVWSFLEPLLMLGVLYIVFTNLLGSGIPNYPLYLLLGLITWNAYARSTSSGLTSLLVRGGVVSRIYFPREILPIAACITSFIMMLFEFGAFGFFMAVFHFIPTTSILYLPIILTIIFVLGLGIALPLSIANIYFRDMQYVWNVILHAGFYLSPIIFSLDVYPENLRNLLHLNPMTDLIEIAHNVVLYNKLPSINELAYPAIIAIIVFIIGYAIFRKFESKAIEVL